MSKFCLLWLLSNIEKGEDDNLISFDSIEHTRMLG